MKLVFALVLVAFVAAISAIPVEKQPAEAPAQKMMPMDGDKDLEAAAYGYGGYGGGWGGYGGGYGGGWGGGYGGWGGYGGGYGGGWGRPYGGYGGWGGYGGYGYGR